MPRCRCSIDLRLSNEFRYFKPGLKTLRVTEVRANAGAPFPVPVP